MKRIYLLIDSLAPGGAQRQLVGLAALLKERGHVTLCNTLAVREKNTENLAVEE